jgi:hypothetical protein
VEGGASLVDDAADLVPLALGHVAASFRDAILEGGRLRPG